METKYPLIMLSGGTTVSLEKKESKVDDNTINILKLQSAVLEGKRVKFRYTRSFGDGNVTWFFANDCKKEKWIGKYARHVSKLASYSIQSSIWNMLISVKPVKVTKQYVVVDAKETKIKFPKELTRAIGIERILSHPRIDHFLNTKKRYYIPYTEEIVIE